MTPEEKRDNLMRESDRFLAAYYRWLDEPGKRRGELMQAADAWRSAMYEFRQLVPAPATAFDNLEL
jgi:hypothetical protein